MNYLIIILGMVLSLSVHAQEKKTDKKKVETTLTVEGVCGMCKDRIENASLRTSGVKFAEWNKTSKQLKLVYNPQKTSQSEIQKAIAKKGHASEGVPKDSTAYQKLPDCCRYADGASCTH
jgi:hypothetical protein